MDFYANGLFNHDVTSLILTAKGVKTTAKQDAYNAAILCSIGNLTEAASHIHININTYMCPNVIHTYIYS